MSTPGEHPRVRSATPVLAVEDVVRTAEYYRDRLGFRFDRYWGEPPCFVILWRDTAEIFFKQACPGEKARPNHPVADVWDAYFTVTDVEAFHHEFNERGAKIVSPPERTVYDMMEMVVEDPDGYRMCFAQDVSGAPRAETSGETKK